MFASWTPPQLNSWRLLILRIFGARIDSSARVYGSANVWYPPNLSVGKYSVIGPKANIYCMGYIDIGDGVVISQGAFLCGGTHDIRDESFPLITREIKIESKAWVCAEAFVGPGVTVGTGAVLAARASAFENMPDWTVWRGNPAAFVKNRSFR